MKMKKYKLALVLTIAVILFSFLLAGCGVAPEKYAQVADQLIAAREKIARLQSEAQDLQAEKEVVADELKAAQAEVAGLEGQVSELEGQLGGLEGQVSGLKEQYELVGATPAETAEKIVRYYHQTHVYSTYDLYVCSDMASDVWNMLKTQQINAVIAVGNKDNAVGEIVDSNHAWVLAEVSPGEYLALETTGGYVVPKSENPLYYRGWSFDNPKELKDYQRLREEYNVRVDIRNKTAAEANEVREEHNRATNQSTADKLEAVHKKLIELVEAQEAELKDIMAEINGLADELR